MVEGARKETFTGLTEVVRWVGWVDGRRRRWEKSRKAMGDAKDALVLV